MAGGILNLVAYGNQNIMLTGNPTKTMFKCTYAKHTNFGLQRFRLDYDGYRTLQLNNSSQFNFKVRRYADLLMDTYFVVSLPDIWSPIYCVSGSYFPYEFKWIENIGSQMIERVRFTIGGQVIQEFTGQYLYNLVEKDFTNEKKELYYRMTGNVDELNNPSQANSNKDISSNTYYPSVIYNKSNPNPGPSIHGRKLYIPLNIWFTLAAKMAFPLISLQYNELNIVIDVRPVKELFVVRDVEDTQLYKKPNFSNNLYEFHRFLNPPSAETDGDAYPYNKTEWNSDVHIISTYAFLTEDENRTFASNPQSYLVKQAYIYKTNNIIGSTKIKLDTMGMVSNWMWYFQRSDINERNEWSNYSNWSYKNSNVDSSNDKLYERLIYDTSYNLNVTNEYNGYNKKDIMKSFGIIFDGKYRENLLDVGVYDYIEKYTRTSGNGKNGLYCYNFGTYSNPYDFQPYGAINLSKFNMIQFEIDVIVPPIDLSNSPTLITCDVDGNTIIDKSPYMLHKYAYDLTVHEERYNILNFTSGNAALMYSR